MYAPRQGRLFLTAQHRVVAIQPIDRAGRLKPLEEPLGDGFYASTPDGLAIQLYMLWRGAYHLHSEQPASNILAAITASERDSEEAFERGIRELLTAGCDHPDSMKRFLAKFLRGAV